MIDMPRGLFQNSPGSTRRPRAEKSRGGDSAAKSLLKNPPGEGTGPTNPAISVEIL